VLADPSVEDKWDEWDDIVQAQKEKLVNLLVSVLSAPVTSKAPMMEPRQSQHLQQKNTGGKGKSKTPPSKGTTLNSNLDTLVAQFLFIDSSDSIVVKFFETSVLSLGKTENIKIQVVAHFRSLMKDRFVSVMDTVKNKDDAIIFMRMW
jgi:hypothetical protein